MTLSPHEALFSALRRFPDVEAENLHAVDASDRLLLDEAAADLAADSGEHVVVIGDRYGALTLGASAIHELRGIRVHQDSLIGEHALEANAHAVGLSGRFTSLPLTAELVRDARVVLVQLPRQLAALDEIASLIAAHAAPDVVVYFGGRIKHLSPAMNGVIERSFDVVTASLARQKSRLLIARSSREVAPLEPTRVFLDELGLWVCSGGMTFAGASLDIGTRHLLEFLHEMKPGAREAVDLGSGTGLVAASLASARPELHVLATDISADAVAASAATAAANDLSARITTRRDIGLSEVASHSVDLVVLNPPFHTGATVHAGLARELFIEAARVLKPGGELWTVYNSHLGYRGALEALVGPTKQRGRNPKFTVTVSTRA